MKLVQVRECDGECCRESPRFPNEDHSDCLYHDEGGCMLMRNIGLVPDGLCPVYPRLTAMDALILHCFQWPQIGCDAKLGETANCCWQWVE